MFKKFNTQWGKLIVHDNLLVARVTDLSLRVKLQKAFETTDESQIIFLSGDYLVFPRAMRIEVEKIVRKAGHIVKTVQAK